MHLQPVRCCAYMPGSILPIHREASCLYAGLISLYAEVSPIYAEVMPIYAEIDPLLAGIYL